MSELLTVCPKCGYARGPNEVVPAWQCPSCGIAYKKYKGYVARAKSFAQPRSPQTGPARLQADSSLWSLALANVFALIVAVFQGWSLGDLMLVYWVQSVVIGISYMMRILSLEKFSTENFTMNDHPVAPTEGTKRQVAFFFLVHYGMFHFVYLMFIVSDELGTSAVGLDFLLCGAAFAINHAYSYRYHRELDRAGQPNIGTLMFTPYLRIFPMHLTIIFGGLMGPSLGGLLLFGTLKTGADIGMHLVEHKQITKRRANSTSS